MPTFKFKLSSEVEVEAPNKSKAMKLVRQEVYEAIGRIAHEAKYISKRPSNTTEFISTIIAPLAKKLQKEFPDYQVTHHGPFGLDVECVISFDNGNENERRSLVFAPGRDFELMFKDFSVNTNTFGPGTIGAINRMNHPLIRVPKTHRIEWIKEHMR